ncbi:PREDICTED: LOW QUALITY PROTEIN: regulator of G-protein signaling 3-like [Pterocles gutturalis]|uniref:LOW QUALITY PROTEIN: regulator of G-protein signaling 3-like n=1 Tax=Pterocles gutturalis TaxID=240206 RepID=UPI000528D645|nr:PREDICTED: LOW QUALITY PROTEIN: regulator of G-protein signaling 3-like [Pterocles gutturalis]
MLETDAEKPGQMHSEDGKAAAGDAPPATEAPAPAEPREALGATQGPVLSKKQPVATEKDEEEEDEEEDEDEEDEEEDSDEHYLERNEVKRSSMIETSGCQPVYTLSVQSSLRRRTHSEGSLLQETKSHCFTSDTTLNCPSDSQGTKEHWALPSPRTLKKELAKNGGSIHQLTLLFSGHRKLSGAEAECSCDEGDETSRKKWSRSL